MGGGDDICEEHCNNNNIYTLTSSTSTPPMFHHGVAASTFPITDDNDNNNFNAGTTSLDPTPSTIPAATTTSPPPPPPLLQTSIAWYCLQASYILTAHIRRAILSCSYAGNSLRRAHETRSWKIAFLEECVEFMLAVLQLKEDCHALGYHPGGEILGSTLRHLDFLFRQCYLTIRFEQQLQLEINRIAALLRNRIGGSSETISIASEQNRSTEELFEVGTAMLASIRECCLTGTAASGYTCEDVLTELESLLRELAWDDLYYQWVSYQNRIQNNPAGNKNGPAGALQNEIDLMMRRKGVTKPDSNYNNVSTKSNSTPGSPSSLLDAVRMVIGSDSSLVSQVLANATRSMSDLRKVISQINTGKLLPLLERISRLQQLLNQAVAQQKNASSSSCSSSASRNNNNNNNDLQMSIAAYRNRLNDTKKEFDTTLEYKKILKTAFESTKRIVVSLSGFVMDAQSLAAILEWCELQHQFLTRIYLPPTTTNNGDSIRIYLTDWAHHLESIRNELHRHCTILVQQLLQQQRNTTTAAGGKMSINCASLLDSPSPFVVTTTTTNSTTTTATTDEDVISQASSELHSLLHERMLKNGSAMPRHLLDLYLKSSYSPLFSVLYSSSSSSSSYVDSLSTVGGERHVLFEFNECFFKAGSLVPQKTKAKFVHWVTHTYNRGISSSTIGGGGAGGGGDDSTTSEERLRRRIAALHAALHQAAAAAAAGAYVREDNNNNNN